MIGLLRDPSSWSRGRQLAVSTRQLATLIAAGIPIRQALAVLSRTCPDLKLGAAWKDVEIRICQGTTLSRAMACHPEIFSDLYLSLIELGESGGGLPESLHRLCDWLDRDHGRKQRLVTALTYPTLALALTIGLTWFLCVFAVPTFAGVLGSMQVELPWPTRVTLGLSRFLSSPFGWLASAAILVNGLAFLSKVSQSGSGRLLLARTLDAIPVLGALLRISASARFCSTLALLTGTGHGLAASLPLAFRASSQPLFEADSERVLAELTAGARLSACFDRDGLYPPVLSHLMAVGEETALLPRLLNRLSVLFEEQASYQIELLTALAEPLLLAFLAGIVGFIVVSLVLPIYSVLGAL